jgi:DNA end-binding protein Ku
MEATMARPIWKGSITFGLVNISIRLEMAFHEKNINFYMMSKDGTCRLRRKLYCPETGKEFDFAHTARGIEVANGEYVLVDEKEIKQLKPERGRTIEILQFIKQDEIDPLYFDREYYIVPGEGSLKPYKLLYDAMVQSKKIAIARFVMRERQYIAAIRPIGNGLVLHTMHYVDEVVSPDDAIPSALSRAKASAREVQVAKELIDNMTERLNLSKFRDEYREELEALIERRKRGKKMVEVSGSPNLKPPPQTTNLMDALRRSLKPAGVSSNGLGNGRLSFSRGRIMRARRVRKR